MTERTYKEEEVREILSRAAKQGAQGNAVRAATQGLTLADIQSIGMEVGVDPHAIVQAAATLDARPQKRKRAVLGVPVEVGRTVQLSRALTDREWEQLVAELRATFRAQGQISGSGGLREWRNGNLHASMEPTERGYRLRLGSRKGDAAGVTVLGVVGIGAGFFAIASMAITEGGMSAWPGVLLPPVVIMGGGVGALLTNLVRLPRWARTRERQMDQIAARVLAMMQEPADQTP